MYIIKFGIFLYLCLGYVLGCVFVHIQVYRYENKKCMCI
jgi:heme/copper-type cytochrome/quinol oxidase subunit 3